MEEWIAHGGLSAAAVAEIRALLAACLDEDRADLGVHRAQGHLRFRHRTAAFLLER